MLPSLRCSRYSFEINSAEQPSQLCSSGPFASALRPFSRSLARALPATAVQHRRKGRLSVTVQSAEGTVFVGPSLSAIAQPLGKGICPAVSLGLGSENI